jgi:Fe-Mn family superoxide dismutase
MQLQRSWNPRFCHRASFVIKGLKREELIASNSMILHELYFDSLGAESQPNGELRGALARDFGSVEKWQIQFAAIGKALGGAQAEYC